MTAVAHPTAKAAVEAPVSGRVRAAIITSVVVVVWGRGGFDVVVTGRVVVEGFGRGGVEARLAIRAAVVDVVVVGATVVGSTLRVTGGLDDDVVVGAAVVVVVVVVVGAGPAW